MRAVIGSARVPSPRKLASLLVLLLLGLVACDAAAPTEAPDTVIPATSTALPPDATAVQPPSDPPPASPTADVAAGGEDPVREITILYTNDEHGWMEGMEPGEGAANLLGRWREVEGLEKDGPFLLLSGGDMWTGPAISTWFEGQSMVEVMNSMGYDAAAVGNHEFDFGLDALSRRAAESDFPLLSANIRYREGGSRPTDLGIEPYAIVEVNGIQIGIIGLTTTLTPVTTNPVNVAGFDFIDYETALREVLPEIRAVGAELILVPAHVCSDELNDLAERIGDLGVHLLGAGHCNELFAEEINGIITIGGGFHLTSYAVANLLFDTGTDTVVAAEYSTNFNTGGSADPEAQALIAEWRDETDAELDQVIGYTDQGIQRHSDEMQALITEAWLAGYPAADVAVTNLGGMRAAISPGDITLADVVGVMPFNNVIIELELTGQETLLLLSMGNLAIGGARREGVSWVLKENGESIESDQVYSILVNDFMYAGGDDFGFLANYDPDGYNTAIDWRQPVIDWIEAQQSSPDDPLEEALDLLGK